MDKYDELFDTYFKGAVDIMKDQITNSLIQLFTENIIKNYKNNPRIFIQKFKVKYITDIDVGSHILQLIQDDIANPEVSNIAKIIRDNQNKVPNKTEDEITERITELFNILECFYIEYYDINSVQNEDILTIFESIQSKLALETELNVQVDIMLKGINKYLNENSFTLEEDEISEIERLIKTLIEESILKKQDEININNELRQGLLQEFEEYKTKIDKLTEKTRTLRNKNKLVTQLQETFEREIAALKSDSNKYLIHDLRAGYMISNILCGVLGYRFLNTQDKAKIITKKKLKPLLLDDRETKNKLDNFLTLINSKPDFKEYLQLLLFEKSKNYFMLEKIKPEHYYKHSEEEYYLANFLSNTATEQRPAIDNVYTMLHKLKETQPSLENKKLNYLKLYGCNATASQGKNFSTMKIGSINNSSFINVNLKSDKFNNISFNNTSFNSHSTSFITQLITNIDSFNSVNNVKLDMGEIFGLYAYPLTSRNDKTILENANFDGCEISGCTFKAINFNSCSVNSGTKFENCTFSICNINFVIKETLELKNCTFIDCKFSNYDKDKGIYKFNKCKFFGPKTREIMICLFLTRVQSGYYYRNFNTYPNSINGFYLSKLNLAAMDLYEFTDCKFYNMYFEHVRFSENTKFDNCTFIDSHFSRSVIVNRVDFAGDLIKTTFTNKCKFYNCDFTHCLISYPAYNPLRNSLIKEGTTFDNCNLQFFANTSKANQFNQLFLQNQSQYLREYTALAG